jgi:hypothetical protein
VSAYQSFLEEKLHHAERELEETRKMLAEAMDRVGSQSEIITKVIESRKPRKESDREGAD